MTRRAAPLTVAGVSAGLLAGRPGRPRTATVSGRVVYQDRPLASGTVTFVPFATGPAATGRIEPDGRYSLTTFLPGDGAIPGRYAVMVVAVTPPDGRLPDDPTVTDPLLVPRKYANHRTSGLTIDVPTEGRTIDIVLE